MIRVDAGLRMHPASGRTSAHWQLSVPLYFDLLQLYAGWAAREDRSHQVLAVSYNWWWWVRWRTSQNKLSNGWQVGDLGNISAWDTFAWWQPGKHTSGNWNAECCIVLLCLLAASSDPPVQYSSVCVCVCVCACVCVCVLQVLSTMRRRTMTTHFTWVARCCWQEVCSSVHFICLSCVVWQLMWDSRHWTATQTHRHQLSSQQPAPCSDVTTRWLWLWDGTTAYPHDTQHWQRVTVNSLSQSYACVSLYPV